MVSYTKGTHIPEPRGDGRCGVCLMWLRPYEYRGRLSVRHYRYGVRPRWITPVDKALDRAAGTGAP